MSSVPGLARSPGEGNGNPVKHTSILAWEIPWTEPGGPQPMGSQTVGRDLATKQQQLGSHKTHSQLLQLHSQIPCTVSTSILYTCWNQFISFQKNSVAIITGIAVSHSVNTF